jgi:hypothetical protein
MTGMKYVFRMLKVFCHPENVHVIDAVVGATFVYSFDLKLDQYGPFQFFLEPDGTTLVDIQLESSIPEDNGIGFPGFNDPVTPVRFEVVTKEDLADSIGIFGPNSKIAPVFLICVKL